MTNFANKPEMDGMSEREKLIIAFLMNDLTDEERTAFERRVSTDEALRHEVTQWRGMIEATEDWFSQEPPGLDRVDRMKPPIPIDVMHRRRKRLSTRINYLRYIRQGLAAAALLLIGFLLGFYIDLNRVKSFTERQVPSQMQSADQGKTPEQIESTPTPTVDGSVPKSALAEGAVSRKVVQEEGKIFIESTSHKTNSRALWVVDGEFRLAQAAVSSEQ